MQVDQKLVDATIEQALTRWPDEEAGAAAVYIADGRILTSVYVETPNSVVKERLAHWGSCVQVGVPDPIPTTLRVGVHYPSAK